MSEILLQTKLFKPRIQGSFVPRPRLMAALNKGLPGKVTLVSAPAGFGKTTLVSSWLQEANQTAAWLSLDALDDEPARFLRYFLASLEKVTAVDPTLSELLQSEKAPAATAHLHPFAEWAGSPAPIAAPGIGRFPCH
ncbi:MAG: hypothetical protein H6656_02770 [Ardenticatenaceae bacterium]|nr:hypothetical protein [Ardenticatenaceae bacterium]